MKKMKSYGVMMILATFVLTACNTFHKRDGNNHVIMNFEGTKK